jgi:predicted CopG family antitoxin
MSDAEILLYAYKKGWLTMNVVRRLYKQKKYEMDTATLKAYAEVNKLVKTMKRNKHLQGNFV